MSTRHPRITRSLGDGWALAWPSTEHVDPVRERELDRMAKARVAELKALLAPSFERAGIPLDSAAPPRAA
jgi:hypothetical protein